MQTNPYQPMTYNQPTGYMPQQYGYNPYAMPQRYPEQQINQFQPQMPKGINGRTVQSVEMITANDVPMDGSVAFFPMQDMSAILAKSWNADGTIKTIVYEPRVEPNGNSINNTPETEKLKLRLSDEVTEVFMQRFDELSNKLQLIEQSMPKSAAKQTTSKKEA